MIVIFLMMNDQVTELNSDQLNNTFQDPISLIKKQPFTLKKHVGEICHGPPTCHMTRVQENVQTQMSNTNTSDTL